MLKQFFALLLLWTLLSCQPQEEPLKIFIGSYTNNQPDKGLYVYSLERESGRLTLDYIMNSLINPSFLKLSPDGQYMYVVTESRLKTPGVVSAYRIEKDSLDFINSVSTGGRNPVHIDVSPDGTRLAVANYTDASLACYKILENGIIDEDFQLFSFQDSSIVRGRQDDAHIHSSNFSIDGKHLFAHDLGGDKIRAFEVSDSIVLRQDLTIEITPGSGPRHFTFDRDGQYGYLINELGGRIDAFSYNTSSGRLDLTGSFMTYEDSLDIYRSADIHITPNNRFLLASNRGPAENTIVVYERLSDGSLKFNQRKDSGGSFPRNFAISPDGRFIIVANKESGNVVVFEFDQSSGRIGEKAAELSIKQASSVQILNTP